MRPKLTRPTLRALIVLVSLVATGLLGPSSRAETVTETFLADGSFTVPAGITKLTIDAYGARGGNGGGAGSAGAFGAFVETTSVSVTPGETLSIVIGGRGGDGTVAAGQPPTGTPGAAGLGGTNGGGDGQPSNLNCGSGGGGGASEVRRGTSPLVVAAGGGGAGGGGFSSCDNGLDGGPGGESGTAGASGADPNASGGGGASPTAGGTGGAGRGGGSPGQNGSVGAGGDGGVGAATGGGGGGGGVFGGGGGGGAQSGFGGGGGGGSSIGPAGTAFTPGVDASNAGNGKVVISYVIAFPDALIAIGSQPFVGDGIYNATAAGQTVTARVARATTVIFNLRFENDQGVTDTFTVRGCNPNAPNEGFSVRYLDGPDDVTAAVKAGTYKTALLDPDESVRLRLAIRISKAGLQKVRRCLTNVVSDTDGTRDAVAARIKQAG